MSQYRRGRGTGASWLRAQLRRRPVPLWLVFTGHVLALGIALVLYALPHHVIPRAGVSVGLQSTRGGMPVVELTAAPEVTPAIEATETSETVETAQAVQPTQAAATEAAVTETAQSVSDALSYVENAEAAPTPTPVPTPTPAPLEPVGSFRVKFAGHFTDGEVKRTDTSYRSANLDITLSSAYDDALAARFYVADIYLADISCLAGVFAQDKYGNGFSEWPQDAARRLEGIVTINGDYYGSRQGGVVIRNGTLYRNDKNMLDLCVLYWDGTLKTFDPFNFDAEAEIGNGAYQCWCFGPALLDGNGNVRENFNSTVKKVNPRSVIGYFEPGHYCFVAVDGRSKESKGLTLADTAALMASMGCKQAYNLDGGQSSMLIAGTTVVNKPVSNGRKSSDFIMILDQPTQ